MKNISFILGVVLLLHSSIIPFVSSYEVSSNNVIYVDDDNIDGPWLQIIQAIKNDGIGQPCLVDNTLISNNIGNDYHPRMTTNSLGHTIVVFEQEIGLNRKQIPVVYSTNDYSWTEQFLFDSINFTSGSGLLQYPDILYNAPNDLLYLTMIDPNAEMYNNEMSFIPGDIVNAAEASWYGISGSTGYFYCACACTNNFFLSLTTEDTYGLLQTLCLGYFTYPDFELPPVMGGWYFDGNSFFQSAPAAELEMDSNSNQIFIVCETRLDDLTQITMKTNVKDEVLMTSGAQKNGMDKYADPEVMPSEYLGVGTDPDVSGSGNKVCVVYVDDGNVLCKSSNTSAIYEPGFNWQVSTVESNASTPAVYMQGNNTYCGYVKDGNLYMKTSEDGGVTWEASEQKNDVNGTVVAEKGALDIGRSGIVFTDNRRGNYDIYFSSFSAPPMPVIVVDSISGGVGVRAVIRNIGDVVAEYFSWSVKVDGMVFVGKETSGAATLQPGESKEIRTDPMLGFGPITITVIADTARKTTDAKLFFFFVMI